MDDLTIDIESVVLRGQPAQDADRVTAAVLAHSDAGLDGEVVSQVSRAAVEAIHAASVGRAAPDQSTPDPRWEGV